MDAHGVRVALVGAGSVGLSLAHAFGEADADITVCGGSTPLEAIAITYGDGPRVGERTVIPAHHATDPAAIAAADIVILAVKAHQTVSTAPWLRRIRPGATLLVAQNGVEQVGRTRPLLDPGVRVAPVIVYFNARRTAPGEATLTPMGERDVVMPDDPASRRAGDLLRAAGLRAANTADHRAVAWRKLLVNATVNPITALTARHSELMAEPAMQRLARAIMDEALRAARADGVHLDGGDVDDALALFRTLPAGTSTSMLQDRLAGRVLEADAINGAIVRAGERHGIPTPLNHMLLDLCEATTGADGTNH